MRLPLAYFGNPILRKKGMPIEVITDELRKLVEDMKDTMLEVKGIGLAAPQVHQSLNLFIAWFFKEAEEDQEIKREEIRVFINPKITILDKGTTIYKEGCLSIPKLYAQVERPEWISVTAMDLEGNMFTEEFRDYNAHIVLHENDHINGVLFIDRLSPKERKALERDLRFIKQKYQ